MSRSSGKTGSVTPFRPTQTRRVLELVSKLSRELEGAGIDYCHWKSNDKLDTSFSGESDLDLLIRREHAGRFVEVLSRLGFKPAVVPAYQRMDGVSDYYGLDVNSGKTIHVHAHYKLVAGDDRTKNYVLPLEQALLRSSVPASFLRVPAAEVELLVFVLRMMIKYSSWEILLRRWDMPAESRAELAWLLRRVDPAGIDERLARELPRLDPGLFRACLASLDPNASKWQRMRAGRRLRPVLGTLAIRGRIADAALRAWRRVELAARRRVRRWRGRRQLATGGALIAVVGGDGSGKTTVVEELYRWLKADFDVCRVHLGRPGWSWTTRLVRGLLKVGRIGSRRSYVRTADVRHRPDEIDPGFPGYSVLLRELCAARDRYLEYRRARRYANRGGIVICDRFPLARIRTMDGAQIEHLVPAGHRTRASDLLGRIERSYYRLIRPPDSIILLRVHPEIAVKRRSDEDPVPVRARVGEIWEIPPGEIAEAVIDTSSPMEQVLREARSYAWSAL